MRTLSPHMELARSVVAGRPTVPAGLDVRKGASLLRYHHLAGLAVAQARRGDGVLSGDLLSDLEGDYHRTAFRSTLVLESAFRAREVLTAAGVPSLLFKGAGLLHDGSYGDPGERFMEDADLLVRPRDGERAVEALMGEGFEPWTPWDGGRMAWLPAFTLSDTEAPDGVEISLDLHWSTPYHRLRATAPQRPDPLWEDADEASGVPAPEAHFVLLAEHVLKHLRVVTHARGLADLVRLAPRVTDAARLARHARLRGGLRPLSTALGLLRTAFGTSLGCDVGALLGRAPDLQGWRARLLALDRLLDPDGPGVRSRLQGLALGWAVRGGAAAALRDVAGVAAPSGSWLRARYPELAASRLRARARYLMDLLAWAAGRGASPLSPNQEWAP